MHREKISRRSKYEALGLRLLLFLTRICPRPLQFWQRGLLIFFLRMADRKHAQVMENNLRTAFPNLTPAQIRNLKARIYAHFARVLCEILDAAARQDFSEILQRAEIRGEEHIQRALQENRGVILLSAHYGNWEWIPLLLHHRFQRPIYSIARPLNNQLIEEKLLDFRQQAGSTIIYKQGSLRKIIQRLAENQMIFLLNDQNTVEREGIFVDFFGKKASTNTTVAQLFLKKQIPVIPLFIHYEKRKIVLEIEERVSYIPGSNLSQDVFALTQQLTTLVENRIRHRPEQWFWFHNRWKTQTSE